MTLSLRSLVVVLTLVALSALVAACGDDPPTAPTTTSPSTATEVYTGTLTAGGSGFYSFSVSAAGSVNLTLASLTDAAGRPQTAALTMGLGVPAGEGCGVNTSVTAPPSLTAQLTAAASISIYCVQLSDAGVLTGPVNFGVRIVHP